MIVTTNEPLAALGQLPHDGAEAILDRILERGTHFVLRGRSYRTRHLKPEANSEPQAAQLTPGRGQSLERNGDKV